jgi:hypothetical protein
MRRKKNYKNSLYRSNNYSFSHSTLHNSSTTLYTSYRHTQIRNEQKRNIIINNKGIGREWRRVIRGSK